MIPVVFTINQSFPELLIISFIQASACFLFYLLSIHIARHEKVNLILDDTSQNNTRFYLKYNAVYVVYFQCWLHFHQHKRKTKMTYEMSYIGMCPIASVFINLQVKLHSNILK